MLINFEAHLYHSNAFIFLEPWKKNDFKNLDILKCEKPENTLRKISRFFFSTIFSRDK